jgi:bacterioferritin-associated ferredoxin
MVVCSCNFLSDSQIKSAISGAAPRLRMSGVYAALGCAAKCGRCAHTIRNMVEEIKRCVTPEDCANDAVTAI